MNKKDARLNILVALPCEAKPINRLLDLKRLQPDGDLPLYGSQDCLLVLAGHGMQAAAAGTRYLHQHNRNNNPSWLNIGIAGHVELPLGEALIAASVIAPDDEQTWVTAVPEQLGCPQGTVQTVTQPLAGYPGKAAYDMEAAGFVSTATAFSPIEKIHVLKVISDNSDNPSSGINAKMVTRLIQAQSRLIRQLVQRILREDV